MYKLRPGREGTELRQARYLLLNTSCKSYATYDIVTIQFIVSKLQTVRA